MKNKRIKFNKKRDEGLTGKLLFLLYSINKRSVRDFILKLFWNLIGNHHEVYSKTIRKIFSKYHNVEIGKYSIGACFVQKRFPSGTTVGNYCSIARTVYILEANHPMNLKSMHSFFFNPRLGYVNERGVPNTELKIGNDVWIGHNAIILPSCNEIGDGVVIAAGSVVNKNIPPYAVMAGTPSRLVRFRFSKEKIEELLKEKWWDKSIEELNEDMDSFLTPIEN